MVDVRVKTFYGGICLLLYTQAYRRSREIFYKTSSSSLKGAPGNFYLIEVATVCQCVSRRDVAAPL